MVESKNELQYSKVSDEIFDDVESHIKVKKEVKTSTGCGQRMGRMMKAIIATVLVLCLASGLFMMMNQDDNRNMDSATNSEDAIKRDVVKPVKKAHKKTADDTSFTDATDQSKPVEKKEKRPADSADRQKKMEVDRQNAGANGMKKDKYNPEEKFGAKEYFDMAKAGSKSVNKNRYKNSMVRDALFQAEATIEKLKEVLREEFDENLKGKNTNFNGAEASIDTKYGGYSASNVKGPGGAGGALSQGYMPNNNNQYQYFADHENITKGKSGSKAIHNQEGKRSTPKQNMENIDLADPDIPMEDDIEESQVVYPLNNQENQNEKSKK